MNIKKEKKIKYKYGIMKFADGDFYYDFINYKVSEKRLVQTYDTFKKLFLETSRFTDSEYDYIIYSFSISYNIFLNSPEISIELLESEYNKNNKYEKEKI